MSTIHSDVSHRLIFELLSYSLDGVSALGQQGLIQMLFGFLVSCLHNIKHVTQWMFPIAFFTEIINKNRFRKLPKQNLIQCSYGHVTIVLKADLGKNVNLSFKKKKKVMTPCQTVWQPEEFEKGRVVLWVFFVNLTRRNNFKLAWQQTWTWTVSGSSVVPSAEDLHQKQVLKIKSRNSLKQKCRHIGLYLNSDTQTHTLHLIEATHANLNVSSLWKL